MLLQVLIIIIFSNAGNILGESVYQIGKQCSDSECECNLVYDGLKLL